MSKSTASSPEREIVIFVLGTASTGKTQVAARLHRSDWHQSDHIPPSGYLKPFNFTYHRVKFQVIDTPGFDIEENHDHLIFQQIEDMFRGYIPRMRQGSRHTTTLIHLGAIYCYPMTYDQLGKTSRRDLQALVALCKTFQFDSFAIFPQWSSNFPSNKRHQAILDLCQYQQIKEIWNDGVEIFEPNSLPRDVLGHLISTAKPFNTPQEGVNWAARLAHAKALIQTLPVDRDKPYEPELVQLRSRLIQAEDFTESLLQSLALPAYNLERKTLAKDFGDLNREISRIVKAIARHCRAERTVGIDKLLVEPLQLDSMHELLSKGHGDRSSASLYRSKSSRQMSVKLFLQSAIALVVCKTLHERVFQPFYPGLEPGVNAMLIQAYQNVQDTNNGTMSGKWQRDTFMGLHRAVEQSQELQATISLAIKDSIVELLRILYKNPESLSAQQQTAFSNLERPFAPFDALVRKAFELNYKIKAEAVLLGRFDTLYYPPGTTFDSHTMVVDGANEEQKADEETETERPQDDEHTVLSTFGLGLIMECNDPNDTTERARELILINSAVVIDESSYDVTE